MTWVVDALLVLKDFSPLAVIALLAVIIMIQVSSRKQVTILSSNDLHAVAETLQRIEAKLEAINQCVIFIKVRLEP